MIRNIVFDMGKVLLDYDPLAVCRGFTDRWAFGLKKIQKNTKE
ncbi:MAG: hypothetical protein SPF91_05885 [Clostridium sp.]|nr:hypothetical protein [Clostridium sp.]